MPVVSLADLIGRDVDVARWSHEGQTVEWWASWDKVMLDDGVEVPAWVEERRYGGGGPNLIIKVAVRDGSPEMVDLRFTAGAGQKEIRQKHLRDLVIDRVAIDLYAGVLEAINLDADASLDEAGRLSCRPKVC